MGAGNAIVIVSPTEYTVSASSGSFAVALDMAEAANASGVM